MDKTTEQPKRGYRKHSKPAEPAAETEPKKGYKKWQQKFLANKWDGTLVSEVENPWHISPDIVEAYRRDGIDLKAVRTHCYGWEDTKNYALHVRNGWQNVEIGDFPDITTVQGDGLQLMARPNAISKKARAQQEAEAREPVAVLKKRAGEGSLEDMGVTLDPRHSSARNYNKIKSSWERLEIPRDE
jgi:hypothetical protein